MSDDQEQQQEPTEARGIEVRCACGYEGPAAMSPGSFGSVAPHCPACATEFPAPKGAGAVFGALPDENAARRAPARGEVLLPDEQGQAAHGEPRARAFAPRTGPRPVRTVEALLGEARERLSEVEFRLGEMKALRAEQQVLRRMLKAGTGYTVSEQPKRPAVDDRQLALAVDPPPPPPPAGIPGEFKSGEIAVVDRATGKRSVLRAV